MVADAAAIPRAALTRSSSSSEGAPFRFEDTTTLEWIRVQIVQFADERGWRSQMHSPRDLLFALTKEIGDLGAVFQYTCQVDLPTVAHEKMIKNARKYPPKITVEPQFAASSGSRETELGQEQKFRFEASSTLELFRLKTVHFADERGWVPNLSPRNLLLALTAEVGELCEIFQWKGDNMAVRDWKPEEKVHLGEELSDVLLYLVQLAAFKLMHFNAQADLLRYLLRPTTDRSFADLPSAVRIKLAKTAEQHSIGAPLE